MTSCPTHDGYLTTSVAVPATPPAECHQLPNTGVDVGLLVASALLLAFLGWLLRRATR